MNWKKGEANPVPVRFNLKMDSPRPPWIPMLGALSLMSCSHPYLTAPAGGHPRQEPSREQTAAAARSQSEPGTTKPLVGPSGEPERGDGSSTDCPELTRIIESPPREKFSAHGYAAHVITVRREHAGVEHVKCVTVAWPSGSESRAGKASSVAEHIRKSWFRVIENTLLRVPVTHAETLHTVVIDNHPTQHGIAAFDRKDPKDGRDGHTIWLSEHLFLDQNHWERGIRGDYFAYHSSSDGSAIHDLSDDHDVFSPVFLHELGHLVMYHVAQPAGDPLSPPSCARTCSDEGTCSTISAEERERPCISPYCRPFKYMASTENWAEQYRFFYQSSQTRALLVRAAEGASNCAELLEEHDRDGDGPAEAPWLRGLPDMDGFRPSRWDSCGGRACKPW